MYYLYILLCSDNTLYTGITNDLEKRIANHNADKGAKYTRRRGPVELIHSEIHPDKSSALKQEIKLKKLKRDEKLNYINQFRQDTLLYSFLPATNVAFQLIQKIQGYDKFALGQSSFQQDLQDLFELAKVKKYKYIIGFGEKAMKRNMIKIETKARNQFRNQPIIQNELYKAEIEISSFISETESAKYSNSIGISWCNYSAYFISKNLETIQLAFLHVPKEMEDITGFVEQISELVLNSN